MFNLKYKDMYTLTEEQKTKYNALLEQLNDKYKDVFKEKVERICNSVNAQERINNLFSKDLKELNRMLSIDLSKHKKEEIENIDVFNYSKEVVQIVKRKFSYTEIENLIQQLQEIQGQLKDKYKQELQTELDSITNKKQELEQKLQQLNNTQE